jgi:AbiV family abortive infection protein
LNQYRGKLDADQIVEGINAAIQNAKRLSNDAKMLLDNGSLPSSVALAILSIEESGKVSILRSMALARDDEERRDLWRDYRWHTKKNVMWILPELVKDGATKLEDFREVFDEDSDHPKVLDQLKQLALYTDCLGSANWSIPDTVIDQSLAKSIVRVADLISTKDEIDPLEIELWVKHLSPVWKSKTEWMKAALENWYKDMQKHGLADPGGNKMRDFIRRGIDIDE